MPNTSVKPRYADGTTLVTEWESKSLPILFLGSSMVEHPAVNRRVVGSNPIQGANFKKLFLYL